MKLIVAIVNNDDAHFVNTSLTSNGFQVTKISSTGGFLMNGNSTFLLGVEDENIDKALDVIKNHCQKRIQDVPSMNAGNPMLDSSAMKVAVGGATVFVLDIDKFIRF